MLEKGQCTGFLKKMCPKAGLEAKALNKLFLFVEEVVKWNQSINLVSRADPEEVWFRHICDSLAALEMEETPKTGLAADIGSGAGLPGIPLAIALPKLKIVSIDKTLKKIIFQRNIKRKLELENFYPIHAKLENYRSETPFDAIFSRALTGTDRLLEISSGLLSSRGLCLFWKGPSFVEEWNSVAEERKREFRLEKVMEFDFDGYPFRSRLVGFVRGSFNTAELRRKPSS